MKRQKNCWAGRYFARGLLGGAISEAKKDVVDMACCRNMCCERLFLFGRENMIGLCGICKF